MKRIITLLFGSCLLLFAASVCFAQMYTVTDLGTLGGTYSSASGINKSGQVVGQATTTSNAYHAFRTAPNSPINPATGDLGPVGGTSNGAQINSSGQVVGGFFTSDVIMENAFRTAPNSPINPATDDLGTLGGTYSGATGINDSGQAVGEAKLTSGDTHAFRTAPNSPINPATDDLGTLGGALSGASGINADGQVVGYSYTTANAYLYGHGFRTAPNSPINPATDDLGTLGGTFSGAFGISDSGQVVGYSVMADNTTYHAFRTSANKPINPATDDLGTLGGTFSVAFGVNAYGQVVGYSFTGGDVALHAFLYNSGVMYDLNDLIPARFGSFISAALDINDVGQIAANVTGDGRLHAVRLDPIYKGVVQPPINADGSSVFSAKRGVVPVKFALTQYNAPSCTLLPATIAITRAGGGTLGSVEIADPNFRITGCQYHYNLAASSLEVGTYRVDISINGIMVGHAVFALK